MMLFRSFSTASKPNRTSITAAKTKKGGKENAKKNSKIEKPKDVGHFLVQKVRMREPKCRTQCQWQEVEAVMLQMHF